MAGPVLRDATRADMEALLELERLCYPGPSAYDRDEYEELLAVPSCANLALVDDGRVVGFASGYHDPREGVGHVVTVNVHPDRRGHGLARRLLGALESRLSAFGARRVQLEVNVANKDAIRLYEAAGYERMGRLRGYYVTYDEPDAFVYEKGL